MRWARTGPMPGRASSSWAVALFRSTSPPPPAPPPPGDVDAAPGHAGHPDGDLLAVGDEGGQVDRGRVGAREQSAGRLDGIGHPGAGGQRDQPRARDQAHHRDDDRGGRPCRLPHRGRGRRREPVRRSRSPAPARARRAAGPPRSRRPGGERRAARRSRATGHPAGPGPIAPPDRGRGAGPSPRGSSVSSAGRRRTRRPGPVPAGGRPPGAGGRRRHPGPTHRGTPRRAAPSAELG